MDVLCWVPFITGSFVQSLSHTLAPIAAAFWQQYRKHIIKEMTGLTAFMYCHNTVSFTCKITHQSWLVQLTASGVQTEKNQKSSAEGLKKLKSAQNLTQHRKQFICLSPTQGNDFVNKSEMSLHYFPPCWWTVMHWFCEVLVLKTVLGQGEEAD